MSSYGKLTITGSSKLETSLSLVLDNIAKNIKQRIDENLYEAVILIGGYGRGEGGVVTIDNEEFPHNNFDFLVISKTISKDKEELLETQLSNIFKKHTKDINIEVEFSIISSKKLKNLQPLVITYDMKYGHKLIVGDASVLVNNKKFELETIPAWDIRNLMVNRGTLLIINDLMLEKKTLSIVEKKIIIKHLIKAIIGYGDALLFHLGNYHYSYVQKNKLMEQQIGVEEKFKKLYKEAMTFRFSPDYETYLALDLFKLQNKIKKSLQDIHLLCEKLSQKNDDLNWNNQINITLDNSVYEEITIKNILRKGYNLTKKMPSISHLSIIDNIKIKSIGFRGMMPILFPHVLFDLDNKNAEDIMDDFFKLNSSDPIGSFFKLDISEDINKYKSAYLSYWKKYINNNFVKEDYGLKERVS